MVATVAANRYIGKGGITIKKIFFFLLAISVLATPVFAWFNDAGNDSCLVAYSREEIYYMGETQTHIMAEYKIENTCGSPINAVIGTYFEDKIFNQVDIQSIQTNAVGANWAKLATPIAENQTTPISNYKAGYTAKAKASNVSIPEGTSYMNVLMEVPRTGEKEEFILRIYNPLNALQTTTLDPFWWDAQMPPDYNTMLYEPFNTEADKDANWSGNTASYNAASGYAIHDAGGAWDGLYRATPYYATDFNFHALIYFVNATNDAFYINICSQTGAVDPTDGYEVYVNVNGNLTFNDASDNRPITGALSPSFSQATWHDLNIDRSTLGEFFLYVDDSYLGKSTDTNEFDYNNCQYVNFRTEDVGDRIDEIIIYRTGIDVVTGDINLSSFDDYGVVDPFPVFAYAIDGNLTIDFNIQHSGNARAALTLDYDGTSIVDDLNLTASVCPDQNFETRSACSWDWNIHRSLVLDGNYIINANVTFSDASSASDLTTNSMRISNDLNLLIKLPIDEELGVPIDINAYTYTIRIYEADNVREFTGLTDENYYSIPKGTDDYVQVEIDTNAPSVYFSRRYAFKYLAAEDSDTLQPYLITSLGTGFQSALFTRTQSNAAVVGVRVVSKKRVGEVVLTMEEGVTDAAGSATFSFLSNDSYLLDFYFRDELIWQNVELHPVYTTYQFYLDLRIFSGIDTNGTVFGVVFEPDEPLIDSNTFVDLNLWLDVNGSTIQNINILVYFDANGLYDANIAVDGFYNIPPLSIVGSPVATPLTVEVILTTTRGETIIRSKSYSVNPSLTQRQLYTLLTVTLLDELNLDRHSEHREVTTLIAVIITIFIVGSLSAKSRLDTTGSSIMGLLILSGFMILGWVLWEVFIVACLLMAALIMLVRRF